MGDAKYKCAMKLAVDFCPRKELIFFSNSRAFICILILDAGAGLIEELQPNAERKAANEDAPSADEDLIVIHHTEMTRGR